MPGNSLTFLTQRYPYATSEDFVTTELDYLCRVFDEVHVIPTTQRLLETPITRSLPKNARLRHDVMEALAEHRARPNAQRVWDVVQDADGRRLMREEMQDDSLTRPPITLFGARTPLLLRALGHTLMVRDVLRRVKTPRQVHAFWLNASALGACLSDPNRPVTCRAHGSDLYMERESPYYIPLQRATLSRVRRCFGISEQGVSTLRSMHPLLARRVVLHRLGVSDPQTQAHASTDGVQRILSVSVMFAVKQLHVLITALQGLKHRVHWTHYGDGPERPLLEVVARNLPENVTFEWPGQVNHARVLQHYTQHPVDVFVNTSRSEGLPVSIMEALSFGVPVVAPDVGGVRELVQPICGALLSAPVRSEEVGQALTSLHDSEAARLAVLRDAARSMWAERVDAARVFPPFVDELLALR